MTNRGQAAAVIYGASVLCAIVVISAAETRPFSVYDVFQGLGFALGASAIPFAFIYAKKIAVAYVSAFIINFLLVAQAVAPTLAGVAVLLVLIFGVAYYVFAPIRDAMRLFLYKRKSDEQSEK